MKKPLGFKSLKRVEPQLKETPLGATVFFILRVSYTTSTLPTDKQLTGNSTCRSCDVCANQFAENDRKIGDWNLHHDNAPAHTSDIVLQFLAKHGTAQCNRRHTHQISHHVTFSYSQGFGKF